MQVAREAAVREVRVTATAAIGSTVKIIICSVMLTSTSAGEFWNILLTSLITFRSIFKMMHGEYEYQFYSHEGQGPTLTVQLVRYLTNISVMHLLILVLGLDIRLRQTLPLPFFDMRHAIRNKSMADENMGLLSISHCNFRSRPNHCWNQHGVLGVLVFTFFLYLSRSLWIDFQRLWMNFIILILKGCRALFLAFRST